MSARTILTLSNGKSVDLLDPKIDASDFPAIAEHLAKEKRFNGATPGREYSVAEHCCLGADAILNVTVLPTGDAETAAYFLMHDLHEALTKDLTTPLKHAVADEADAAFGELADKIMETFKRVEQRVDRALHLAAGLQWPAPSIVLAIVKRIDKVMFVTEWRDLMGGLTHPDWSPYEGIDPLPDRIDTPWPWHVAMRAWMRRAQDLLPALSSGARR